MTYLTEQEITIKNIKLRVGDEVTFSSAIGWLSGFSLPKAEFPLKEETQPPPKPEPSLRILTYQILRDLLDRNFEKLKRGQERMEQVFTLRLRALKTEGAGIASDMTMGISSEFLEYLMGSAIRKLGHLLPRAKRAYLRDPEDKNLVFLVTYEFQRNTLTVSIGNNLLRRD